MAGLFPKIMEARPHIQKATIMVNLTFKNVDEGDKIDEKFKTDVKETLSIVFKNKIPVAEFLHSTTKFSEQIKNILQYTYEQPVLIHYPTGGVYGQGELVGTIAAGDDVLEWAGRPMSAKFRLQVQNGYVEKFGL